MRHDKRAAKQRYSRYRGALKLNDVEEPGAPPHPNQAYWKGPSFQFLLMTQIGTGARNSIPVLALTALMLIVCDDFQLFDFTFFQTR